MPDFHAPGGPSVVHALGRPSLLLTCTLRELGVLYEYAPQGVVQSARLRIMNKYLPDKVLAVFTT